MPDTSTIDILAVYAPSKDTPEFWEKAAEIMAKGQSQHRIIIGDFNCTLNHKIDQQGYKTDPHTKSRNVITNLLEQELYIDSFRHLNPDKKSYTFRTKDGKTRSRLDYCLTTPALTQHLKEIKHIAHHYDNTDHSTISLEIDITKSEIGNGIFRCPPNTHNNLDYQILIKNTIKKAIFSCKTKTQENDLQEALFDTRIKLYEEYMSLHKKTPAWNTLDRKQTLKYTILKLMSLEPTNEELLAKELTISKPALLEYVLLQMKTNTINYLKIHTTAQKDQEKQLKEELQQLITEDIGDTNLEQILATEHKIKDLETKKIYDVLSKSKNYKLLDDERPTKTFLNLESSKAGYSEITKLRIINPHFNETLQENATNKKYYEITDPKQIRSQMYTTFQEIYTAQPDLDTSPDALFNFLSSDEDTKPLEELNKRQITRQLSNSMEGLLTVEELTKCLFNVMKGASSPGCDGFTVNYLRVFWEDMKHLTTDALNSSFGNTLTTTLRKAVVKLLRKGTKDPTLPGNYRPISLLSIFYKLASCAITQRIKPAVASIIGRQQKAYLQHNNIGSCIINLINLIKHTISNKQAGLILLIDFKKAFDSISHNFIENTLHILGFGPDIICWIKTFLKNRDAQILLGGHLTDNINLEQGVPQGDILSPYIFIIMVEILLIKITTTKNIIGITYATKEARAETFADDTTLFMTRTETNLRNAVKYIKHFHKISGLACNLDKTSVIPIGTNTNVKEKICIDLNMIWEDTFTILGFEIDNNLKNLDQNYQKIKDKIQSIIAKWKPYHLSLKGRLTIAKTKLISQVTYISTVLTPNATITNEMQTMINNYIMGISSNSKNWINKDLIYTHTSKGGFGMVRLEDFMRAIKISWIKRYCIDKIDDHWADIIDNYFHLLPDSRKTLLKFGPERYNRIIKKEIPVISNLFAALKNFKHNFPTNPGTMDNTWINQCAFYNMNITRKQPNSKQATYLTPTFYGISDNYHTLALKDLFNRGSFITNEALNTLTNSKIHPMQYTSLKNHIKSHIGHQKTYDAIPMEKLPQKKYTYSTICTLMENTGKGSGIYRKVIGREHKTSDIHNPAKWNKRLNTTQVTRKHVKKTLINLQSPYLDSTTADYLSRLKLCKTLFNSQLHSIGISEEKNCKTCIKEFDEHIEEDYKHAMYLCPAVQQSIACVTETFFPDIPSPFNIEDILTAVTNDKHNLYKGQEGQKLASTIWDIFQTYIIKCHSSETTPVPVAAIFEIRSQLNRILKILPKSRLSLFIKSSEKLLNTINYE